MGRESHFMVHAIKASVMTGGNRFEIAEASIPSAAVQRRHGSCKAAQRSHGENF